jgi:hypothetical protein
MTALTTTTKISPRAKELLAVLDGNWTRSVMLDALVKKHWRGPHRPASGFHHEPHRPLKPSALRAAVLQAARELCALGLAEQKLDAGPRGGRVLFLRRSTAKTAFSERGGARNGDEIRAARRSDPNLSPREARHYKTETPHQGNATKPGISRDGLLH